MSRAWDDQIARAKAVDIADVIAARGGLGLKQCKTELVGACPHCGGEDRFSVCTRSDKQVFNCRGCDAKGDVIDLVRFLDGVDFTDAIETLTGEATPEPPKLKANGHGGHKLGRIVATYNYTDAADELLFQVVRYDPKDFRQRRPGGKGGWIWNVGGVEQVPYRAPELIEAIANEHIVAIVEGEKDADNLWKIGVPATTNAMGAGKWNAALNKYFAHADVILIPDNDDAGHKHVQEVGAALTGIAKRIRVLVLPDLPAKGDVSYWLQHGGTREALDALVEPAPEWRPPPPEPKSADAASNKTEAGAREKELIDELARLNRVEFDKRRKRAAHDLGIRNSTLDNAVEARRQEQAQEAGPPPLFGHWVVEPWPEEVDAGALLLSLVRRIRRHVVISDEEATTVALWILNAWVHDVAATHSAILMATSAEANSGKTTLLSLLSFLVPRALLCVEISEATLFRGIELWQPTVIVDEADVILINNEPLRAVVNSGWTRGAVVPRCIGDDKVPHAFPTFCPKAIGLKGRKLPDTTLSRCIVIELKRKRSTEKAEHFRALDDPGLAELRQQATRWAMDNGEALKGAEPDMPDCFDNRLGDNWRLLLAIADLAGGEWPDKARETAQVLSKVADTASIGAQLLADIKAAFDGVAGDVISSAELVEKLTAEPDMPWSEWKGGKPITQNQLGRLLKPFGITPDRLRVKPDLRIRGYHRAWFEDAWERYL